MKNLGPLVRCLLMVPLFLFIWMGTIQAQTGCTTGWSTTVGAPIAGQVNVPTALGGGLADYVDVDIFLDANCFKRFNLSVTPFESDCNIVEYYNMAGQLVGVEDQDVPGSSTFIFNTSDIDGTPGLGGYPSGVADNPAFCDLVGSTVANGTRPASDGIRGDNDTDVDYQNEGYSPDYACQYEPESCLDGAEAGQFFFFRVVQDIDVTLNANATTDGYHFFDGLIRNAGTTYRAIRIRSVTDGSGPIITGSINTLCVVGTAFDNCPTPLVGDPRAGSNLTHDANNDGTITDAILTDNDALASDGTSVAAGGTLTALAALGGNQVRAITCAELPTTNGLTNQPFTGGLSLVYGTEPADIMTIDYGTGFIDSDANGNGISDATEGLVATIPGYISNSANVAYDGVSNIATLNTAAGGTTTGTAGDVTNAAPDGCGTAVNVSFLDLQDFSERGNIYDNFALATVNATDATTATFGGGQDGRFRYCYTINRTWTATDASGNDNSCVQELDVIDDFHAYAVNTGNPDITKAGSPYFQAVNTVNVSPTTLPTTATPTDNAVTLYGTSLPYFNINNIGFTTVEYSPGYDLTPAAAPNAAGAQGYEFPVFIYDESTDAFDCTELTTLDGFSPAAMDNCGILRIDPIESLFDYGLDGDFGDDNSALFPTSPLIPQTFAFNNDLATPAYELESVLTAGLTTATDDNDDLAAGTNPFNCSFYEYDLLRRWRVVDNCGFQSVAQRIYHIRDREAPAISSATITVGGSPIFYTAALTAETMSTLNTPNIRTYSLNSTINIVSNDCMPVLDILANTLDNCADNQYLNISYAVNTLNNNALPVQVASGNLVNGNTMIPLPVNGTYTVVVSYNDPCGNVSNLEVDVTTTQTDNPLNFNSLFNTEIGTTGAGAVDFFDIAPPSQVQEFLSNLCNLPSCVELVVRGTNAFGAPLEDRAFYQVDQNNATLIGIGTTNDPSIILTCDDIGSVKQVSVEIYEETNCNFTTTPISTNVGSVSTLLETRTSTVTVTGPAVSPFSVSTSSVPASSNVATDGSINVTITPASSTPTQLYDITYTGPVSGSLTGINLAASNPTTINGLSEGSYTITVRGQTSCLTETTVVNLGTGMPANATLSCPTNVTTGPTSFTLLAGTGFSNITSLSLQVSLTGPAGVDIPSASLVGAFATNVNGQGGVFGLSDDPFTPNTFNVLLSVPLGSGVSAASGDPLISFQLDVPATANVGDVISVVVTGTALQSTGFGTPSTSVPFNGSNCSISVAATSSGTLGASGQVMYMYCGAPVENVQVTLTSTNPTQSSFTDLNGNYGFSSIIQSGTSITITPSLMSFNPSTTTYQIDGGDLSALLSLLLTATPISPYQLVAADINGDGFLDAADAILLLNNINTSNATFLNSWIFVNANQTLNAFSPTPAANLETSFVDATFTSSAPIDFIGVKPGDILPDCTTGSGVVIRGVTPMVAKDRAIAKGEGYELDFNLRDFDGVKAFQTVLNFDPSVVRPTEVIISEKLKAAGLTDVVIESSSIRLLGASADAIDLAAEDALISVRFEAVKSARSLKTAFAVSQENPSLIFNDGADGTDRYQLILLFDDKDTTPSTLEVYGSYPNPFNTTTSIQFGLSQSDLVQLTVTDVTGRVVYELNAQFDAGQNQIDLNAADLKASGLLIYTIRTSDTKYSDKLLLVE